MCKIKYTEIKARYDTIEWEKAPYNLVVKRIIHDKIDRVRALTPWSLKHWIRVWDEYGRPCSKCKIYYTRDWFHKRRWSSSVYKYDSSCKECKKIIKREYVQRLGHDEIKRRQNKTRHIPIWSFIWLQDYIHYDENWNPREVIREVISYKPYVGYTLRSKEFWLKKQVAFRSCIGNYKFYVVERPKEKVLATVVEDREFESLRM